MSSPYQRNDENQNKVPTSSLNTDKNIDSDLEASAELKRGYPSYPVIRYLNVNSIKNKIVQLTVICKTSLIDILCRDESKLVSNFPNTKIHLPDYQFPLFWRDRNSSGGGKIVYIRNGIIAKMLTVYETQNTESICVEVTIKKRKWGILFTYRLPNNNNLKLFFEETTQSANQLLSKFDNIIITGDFNIKTGSKNCNKFKQFADFCHNFNLTDLIPYRGKKNRA